MVAEIVILLHTQLVPVTYVDLLNSSEFMQVKEDKKERLVVLTTHLIVTVVYPLAKKLCGSVALDDV